MVNIKAVVQTIYYIHQKTGPLEKMKLVKFVYLADKLHLLSYGRTITHDNYRAMMNGPVGSTTLDIFNEKLDYLKESDIEYSKVFLIRSGPLGYQITNKNIHLEKLSRSDTKIIDQIIEKFSHKSREELVEITHQYPEWKQFEKDLLTNSIKSADIQTSEMFSVINNDPLGIDAEHAHLSKEAHILQVHFANTL
jgi:uncharacterized phage-associated protein